MPLKKIITIFLVFFILLIFFPKKALATSYYVSTSGNDNNSGTISSSWRTIQKAVSTMSAGDTAYIRGGTYNEQIIINRSGTSSSPITLTNYQDENVTIAAGSGHGIRDSGGQSYWIIDGLTISTSGSMAAAIQATSSEWGGSVTNHWTIRNNTMRGGGVLIKGHHHLVEGNDINGQHVAKNHPAYQTGIRDTYAGGSPKTDISHHNTFRNNSITGFYRSAIWSMLYTHDNVIEGNTVSDIYGGGSGPGQCINLDSAGGVTFRQTVRNNTISGCGAEGIQLENCFDCLVENNILNVYPRAITVISYDSRIGCATVSDGGKTYGDRDNDGSCKDEDTNTIIRQNVIYNSGTALVNYGMDGVHYLNNSVYNSQSYIFNDPSHIGRVSFINNIISSVPSSIGTNHHNLLTNNPGYVDPSRGNLALKSSATGAIDRGADISSYINGVAQPPSVDFAGNSRYQGSSIDIGAYEYGGSPPPPSYTPTSALTPTTGPLRDPENPSGVVEGINYQYYEGIWTQLPDFSSLTPIKAGSVNNFNLSVKEVEDYYALTFSGYIDIPQDGVYLFYLNSDDESKLLIGDTEIVSSDWDLGEQVGSIGLKKGKHSITVLYHEYDWNEYLEVSFSGPNLGKQLIPDTRLFHQKPSIPGDLDDDGDVDIIDFQLLNNAFGSNNIAADINSDGIVNILDFQILSNNFGK